MQFGHFDDANKEYVITRPDTPRSWSNYLGSKEYGALITNHAGGYSFYKSSAQGRFMRMKFNSIPMDQPGRYFYLRDQESKDYWSASWQPVGKDLSKYETTCRHGTGYTIITSRYADIESEATYFVPLGAAFEIWMLKVTNRSTKPRKLSVFSFLEYTNEWNTYHDQFNLQYSQYIVKCEWLGNLIAQSQSGNLPEDPAHFENRDQSRHTFLGLVGAQASGYDTDREIFIGPYRDYANPLVVEQGKCTGSQAHGDNACGVMQIDLELQPGESKRFMVILGVGKAETVGRKVLQQYDLVEKADAALAQVKAYWHSRLGQLVVHSPDPEFDSMVNVWNAYNRLITFNWSRSASLVYVGDFERDGLGYRDTVQDIMSAVVAIPQEARQRLELMLTGQVSTGGAMPVVKQFNHRPGQEKAPSEEAYRADDCLWLFNTVPAYVKETGDLAFYEKVLSFADKGEASVFGHLRRALEFNLERCGQHGLPCGLYADWNDCLRLGFKGESTFVAFQLYYGLKVYGEIAEMLRRPSEVEWAGKQLAVLEDAVQKHAWDGRWFLRAYREDGTTLGSQRDEEGSIFLEPQVWAVMSGVGTPEQRQTAMDSVRELLATPYGVEICTPPYRKVPCQEVRAVLFAEGCKENAGIFSHTQGWAAIAECLLGRGDLAYQYYRAYMPAAYNTRAEIRQVEPYVHCQSTHSRYSPKYGVSRNPWLSGTATWSYFSAVQNILGIQPDYDGLRLDPVIPSTWAGFQVTRAFRGATYQIHVKNPNKLCRGVKRMLVDGKEIPGNLLPLAPAGTTVKVDVVLEG